MGTPWTWAAIRGYSLSHSNPTFATLNEYNRELSQDGDCRIGWARVPLAWAPDPEGSAARSESSAHDMVPRLADCGDWNLDREAGKGRWRLGVHRAQDSPRSFGQGSAIPEPIFCKSLKSPPIAILPCITGRLQAAALTSVMHSGLDYFRGMIRCNSLGKIREQCTTTSSPLVKSAGKLWGHRSFRKRGVKRGLTPRAPT